jgi:hypothetical protein
MNHGIFTNVKQKVFSTYLSSDIQVDRTALLKFYSYKYKKQLNKLKDGVGMVGPKVHKQD